ncbi:YrhB domain-containing protein [Streptomyces sp. NRRL B-24484]|uniref:YrhB domain-containing protein n=1 Tax=Streptomyces sp. NRRL B-24484 TaxID=1463833 RepID=UPI0006939664|nr:YrhB domain-containing protein [Streptomyces sp. NRRL B-24484]
MITEERAVELVEARLARDRLTEKWMARLPEFAVHRVEEHGVGWLVFCQSVTWLLTRNVRDSFPSGPYLVDRRDGSLHFVRTTCLDDDWQTFYRREVLGGTDDDPVVIEIRDLARTAGPVAAMQQLRRLFPQLVVAEAKAYVTAVAQGVRPSEDLVQATRPGDTWLRTDILRVTGPAGQPLD